MRKNVYGSIVVLGLLLALLGSATSAAAEVGPFAKVLNSKGEVVNKWGAAYGAEPGTQIQLAENFAECGNATHCSTFPSTPMYPKVTLEPGVYHLLKAYGSNYPLGGPEAGVGPLCEGIFAYSGVVLEGSSGTEIGNNIAESKPCPVNPKLNYLSSVLYVGPTPENLSTFGNAMQVSHLKILGTYPSNEQLTAEYGLMAMNIEGANLSVSNITENGSKQAAIIIGREYNPVSGTSSSPAQIIQNTVENSGNEGIVLEGKHMHVAENAVTGTGAHGIAVFGASPEYIEIAHNTITSSSWGVSLDGSLNSSLPGRENSVLGNTITDTCVGTILYRQVDARIAGNVVEDPYTGWHPTGKNQGCPEFSSSVGVAILDSCDNGVWNNRLFNFQEGVWIQDGGVSPSACGGRTTANYVGRVLEIGHPWPWPVSGNWIEHPEFGFVAASPGNPGAASGNEFAGNAIDNWSRGMWYFEPGESEITNGNT